MVPIYSQSFPGRMSDPAHVNSCYRLVGITEIKQVRYTRLLAYHCVSVFSVRSRPCRIQLDASRAAYGTIRDVQIVRQYYHSTPILRSDGDSEWCIFCISCKDVSFQSLPAKHQCHSSEIGHGIANWDIWGEGLVHFPQTSSPRVSVGKPEV